MAENFQFLNKHVICYKNIGCCCTMVCKAELLTEILNSIFSLQFYTFISTFYLNSIFTTT